MSRYECDIGKFSVSVGRDNDLKTCFGFIEQKDCDSGKPLIHIGNAPRAYPKSDAFIQAFTESARAAGIENFDLPLDIKNKLKADDDAAVAQIGIHIM